MIQCELAKFQEKKNLIVKLSDNLNGITASQVFETLSDFRNRPKWDFISK